MFVFAHFSELHQTLVWMLVWTLVWTLRVKNWNLTAELRPVTKVSNAFH